MFFSDYKAFTWKEISEINKDNACLVLPVSSVEQHGKHLPVGTDNYILKMCMEELHSMENKTGTEYILLPEVTVGKSAEHMNFSGTITYSVTTYYCIIRDIVESLSKSGFKKMVIINGHGGNTALLNGFSQELNQKYNMYIYNLDIPAIYSKCNEIPSLSNMDIECEIHAGEIETSLMLYKYPELVNRKMMVNVPVYFENYNNCWITDEISESGVLGKPEGASEKEGKIILEYIVEHMYEIICKIAEEE